MQKKAKRVAALLAAIMMSTSVLAESAMAFEQDSVIYSGSAQTLNADSTAADTIVIYDELGQNISNGKDAYIYLDNKGIAGGKTSTSITVKVSNKAGNVSDRIYYVREASKDDKVRVYGSSYSDGGNTLKLDLSALDASGKSLKPGTTYLEFSTASGEVYRKLYVVIYQPTEDITITSGAGSSSKMTIETRKYAPTLDGIEIGYNTRYAPITDETGKVIKSAVQVLRESYADAYYRNTFAPSDYYAAVSAVANHKFQFNAAMTGTDKPQWKVFDGPYHPGIEKDGKETALAEISKDGTFTPKKNGIVTVMVKAMPTLPYMCKETDTQEGVGTTAYTNNAYTETFKRDHADLPDKSFSFVAKERDKNGDVKDTRVTIDKCSDHTVPKFIQVNIIKENPAKAMKFKNPPAGMQIGETAQLNLDMTPSFTGQEYTGATDVVEWTSSNSKVITVDSKGQITAVGKGEATITAQGENPTVSTSCIVRVYSKATGVKITPSPASTRIGVPISLTATLSPDTAEDEIVWTSSDNNIATVEAVPGQFGNLTQKAVVTGGTKKGTVTITATAKYSGVEAKCTVTVNDRIDSDSIELYTVDKDSNHTPISEGENIDLFNDKSIDIEASLTAKDGSTPDDKITWTVLNNAGNFISTNEKSNNAITVNGLSEGEVKVIAASTANPSIKRTFTISVIRACDNVKLTNETGFSTLKIGETASITATLTTNNKDYPNNHDDRVKSWTSSNEKVAKVNDNGTVTCTGYGSASITCTTMSGKTAKTTIIGFLPTEIYFGSGTKASADGQSLPTAEITLKKNKDEISGTAKLTAVVRGLNSDSASAKVTNISGSRIAWTSSDESVAKVDESGNVTAYKIGETVITAASGTKSTSALVSVKAPVTLFEITVDNCVYSPANKAQIYTPIPVVKLDGTELKEGVDYSVEYSGNNKISTGAKVTITGLGSYTGTVSKSFSIQAKPLSDDDIKVDPIARQQATGKAITPEPKVSFMGFVLVKDTDYTLKYSNNTALTSADKKAVITIQGKGSYTANTTVDFDIFCEHPKDKIQQIKVTKEPTCTAAGTGQAKCELCGTPFTTIPATGHTYVTSKVAATYDADGYTLHKCSKCGDSYKTDIVPKLAKTDLSKCTATLAKTAYTYTGSQLKPTVTVKNGAATLKSGTDYTVAYTNNIKVGTATVTITGKAKYSGKITKTFKINAISIAKATVSGIANKYYTGKAITQAVVVKVGSRTLKAGTDYTVSYKNNKAIGKATVTIRGKGSYTGTISKAFKINPKKTTLKSVKSPKTKQMKVTYTKVSGVTGYEILYATNSKFTSGKKTVTVKNAKTVSKTISKLTKGKTYYVKVRTYKTVSGTKYYSGYSAAKKIKVK